MKLLNHVRGFLIDQEYYIDIYENKIHVFHYIDILKLQDEEIILQMSDFKLVLKGVNFRVSRLENREILISGVLDSLEMIR